jgi:hypothetical protein
MEGRERQLTRVPSGTREPPPSGITFSTKLSALAERARRIRNEPLRTVIHLVDRE